MEPFALGELNLTPEQFGGYTVNEIDAMFDGYMRRQERLEDMFIIYCALPTYRGAFGKKAPSYRALTKHRKKHGSVGRIEDATADYWRTFLKEEEAKTREAQSARAESQNRITAAQRSRKG